MVVPGLSSILQLHIAHLCKHSQQWALTAWQLCLQRAWMCTVVKALLLTITAQISQMSQLARYHQAVSMAKGSCTRHLKRSRAANLNWTIMLSAKRGLLCRSSSTGLTSKSSFLRAARSLWREDRASQLPHGYSLTGQNLQSPYASGQPHFPLCAIWTQR